MNILSFVFIVKILISLVLVSLPMLFLSEKNIQRFMKVPVSSAVVYRLYGIAILALLVGYSAGLVSALDGELNTGIVLMGIVSNLGASAIMLMNGYWKMQKVLWLFFTTIGLLLLTSLSLTEQMLAPLG